ncbi:MFS transporter [Abyssisolibacter fermentans]|uniref:MFS transporter n=1 Tax=Abyssisolibacter fermentans TaxID=1766203 RepID=UPI000B04D6E0|nr:MFS transporter [Abyssisolibacter fermentans]
MSYKTNLNKNINRNYLYTFISSLNLSQGLWMIYLAAKGMSLMQLGILEAIFHITSFFMEIPTGIVADIYGRKVSRITGRFASVVSTIILLYSNNFYWFMISFVISALSYNLESGAGEALVYDSLKEIGKEKKYMKINGKIEMFMQIGCITSYIVGGYLATKSYLMVFALTAVFETVSFIQAFSFTEPSIKNKTVKEKNPFIVLKNQFTKSIGVLSSNKRIGFLIVFGEIISATATSLFFYLQNYWKGSGYSEIKIGIIFSIASLLGAIIATKVYKIERVIKEKGVLILMPLITILCLWGVVLTKFTYVFYIIISVVEGIIFVAVGDYINKQIPSKYRATILSFRSMVFSFFMILLFPLIGKLGDVFSIMFALKNLAIIGSILYIIHLYFLLNSRK